MTHESNLADLMSVETAIWGDDSGIEIGTDQHLGTKQEVEYLRILRPTLIKREDNEPIYDAGLHLADAVSSIVISLNQGEFHHIDRWCRQVLRISGDIGMKKSAQFVEDLQKALRQDEVDDAKNYAKRLEALIETYIFTAVNVHILRQEDIATSL